MLGWKVNCWPGAKLQPGEAAGEFLDGQPGLELSEVGAQAVVQALAEGQVLVSVRAAQIEPFRFGKYRGVAAGGA